MGYRDDAFYNLADREDGTSGAYSGNNNSDNAKFMFPAPNIRFLAAQSYLDSKKASGGTADHPTFSTVNDYKIQRGYIRGLNQPGIHNSSFKPLKCSFQFNPQTIQQSVSMREDVYLPIMQDPIQFAQPFGGSVNFGFDLLFDRSMELAQGASLDAKGYAAANRDAINYKEDVRDIGAMADLQVLYSIIGQGFSKELLDFQASRLKQAAQFKNNADVKGGGQGITVSDSDIGNFINEANIGNSAFLIPNPVRVIFSSMFMVDGFVTGTNVDFLKFSTNMVPMQVRVSVSMNAIYIGFARQKTFLTEQLEKAGEELKAQQDAQEAAQAETRQLAKDVLKEFRYITGGINATDARIIDLDVSAYGVTPCYQFAFEDSNGPANTWTRGLVTKIKWPGDTKEGDPPIGTTLEKTQIDWKCKLKVWGPFDTKEEATKVVSARGQGYDSKVCGFYNWTGSTSEGSTNTQRIQKVLKGFTSLHNQAVNKLSHGSGWAGDSTGRTYATLATKYYGSSFNLEISLKDTSSGTDSTSTASQTVYHVNLGSEGFGSKIPLSWTTSTPGNRQ